jgi:small-conductance mechanosensitive channel
LLEAARRTGTEHSGVLAEPAPTVRLIPGFADRGIVFTLTVWIRQFADQDPVQDTIRRHALELAAEASIAIRPGPQ